MSGNRACSRRLPSERKRRAPPGMKVLDQSLQSQSMCPGPAVKLPLYKLTSRQSKKTTTFLVVGLSETIRTLCACRPTLVTYPLEVSPDFRHDLEDDVEDATMATLTKRQKQMVDFLEHYIEENGYAPTLAEAGQYFGLSSLATVHKHLRNLEQKGFIKRQHNHSRALEVSASA